MNKKIFVLVLLSILCLWSTQVHALILVPSFNVTVNENAVGGSDGNFSFHLIKSNINDPETTPVDDFDIQTVSGVGTDYTGGIVGTGDVFGIIQDPLSGWQAPTVSCTSANSAVTTTATAGGVFIVTAPYSSVTCTFTNNPAPVGASNVLFIPGFEGSRLYKNGNILNPEDQLWEPNANSDVTDLSMDSSGVSQNNKIYTRNILDESNILPVDQFKVYKSFEDSLDTLVASNTISSWAAAPYDWRYDPTYVVNHGVLTANGDIFYENTLTANQTPFIISQLEALIASSKTGKVTIVTHSNGGLVVKALIEKLQAMHTAGQNDDIDHVDRVIMVAAPQIGTPEAIGALLHGNDTDFEIPNLLPSPSVSRDFGKNVPGAYALLPDEKYFTTVVNPVITFDSSLTSVNNFYQKYGPSITTYPTFKNFLLAISDNRLDPESNDLAEPSVLNARLLNSADALHRDIDNYQIPSSIQVYQVAGWGESTASRVEYTTRQECALGNTFVCNPVLDEKLGTVSDGDGRVVTPSAVFGAEVPYYVNLQQYNNDYHTNNTHVDIFETLPVISLIQDIIEGDTALPKYVTTTKPSGSDNLVLSTHSPVTLDIYDSAGRHTGLSQVQSLSDFQQVDEQIPNSAYIPFGEGTYISVPNGNNYKVNISGTDFGTFTFEKEHDVNDQAQSDTVSFADIPVTPMTVATLTVDSTGNPSQMQVDVDGDGTVDETISAGTEIDPIQYLEMIRKTVISMQLAQSIENAIIKKINKLETDIQSGKIKNAKLKIKTLLEVVKIHRGHKKRIDESDKQALVDMFNQLLDNLN